mgnify:CR=1 FL=1
MRIGNYPIKVVVEGIGIRDMVDYLRTVGYTDFGLGKPSIGADQMWKYFEGGEQIHVRMWSSENVYLSFLVNLLSKYFRRDISRKVFCSPHREPAWYTKEHREMLIHSKEADYSSGTEEFLRDLRNLTKKRKSVKVKLLQ